MKKTHIAIPLEYVLDQIKDLETKVADPNTRDNIVLEYEGSMYAYDHILQTGTRIDLEISEIEEKELKVAGFLTKPFGIVGYHRAEIGHVIYDENDRYVIYLTHDKQPTLRVPFYKESFNSIQLK